MGVKNATNTHVSVFHKFTSNCCIPRATLTCKTNYFPTNNITTILLPFKTWSVLHKSGNVIHSVRVWLILRAQNAFIGALHFKYFPYNLRK